MTGPTTPVYADVAAARAAGATGTDTEITAALLDAEITIDRYCRDHFAPAQLSFRVPVDAYGVGYLPVIAYAVDVGTLGYDGRTWTTDEFPPFGGYCSGIEFDVPGDYGWRTTPTPVSQAAARLAALYRPAPFTAQADDEGNPIGRPPAPTVADETDPAPPTQRSGSAEYERTTGDPTVDAWLEPYKSNRVLI
jgi:hypothetical protein